MPQVDEGLIHSWLDGQLAPDEAARVERLVASDPAWGAAAAEARGLVAGASRILSALDDVPSVENIAQAAHSARRVDGARRPAMRLWRSASVRAAAGLVLAVGLASLVWRDRPQTTVVPAAAAEQQKDALASATVTAVPVAAAPPAVAPVQKTPREQHDARNAKAATGTDAPQPPAAPPAAGAAGGGAESRATIDRATNEVAPRSAPVVAQQGAASRGDPARKDFASAASALALTAKTLGGTQLDPALSGCWIPTDSAAAVARDRARSEPAGFVLHFVEPTVTDARGSGGGRGALQRERTNAEADVQRQVPAGTRIQNTAPRKLNDSTYVTEWVQSDATMQLTFTVRGDTLRGTSVRTVGDMVFAAPALMALRAICPR